MGKEASVARWSTFLAGAKDTFPLVVGAIPFGVIFGALAVTAGLSPAGAMGMSLFVFAGSAQFIAAGLIAQGIAPMFIVLTTFIVNLRHVLYSASLAPYLKHLPRKWLLPLGFWLTDETYAVTIRRYQGDGGEASYRLWYYLGSAVFMYANWQLCTLIGIVAGQRLQNVAEWGLDFAMVATFTGIVVPLIVNRPMLICALVSGVTAVLANGLPNRLGLMLAASLGIAAGYAAELLLTSGGEEEGA
ncbi:MAG TPA: branched-chain amino acid ABC transporter permease [Chloroflexi bacterium]|nr:branched-chain amino acid ABC transporter permease [Chloroflexota bacterium]